MSALQLTDYEATVVRAALLLVLAKTDLPRADRMTLRRVLNQMRIEGVEIVLRRDE